MSLSIVHISDIHIKGERDVILKRIAQLKTACASAVGFNNDVIILVSGDIAFSGQEEQYVYAACLFDELSDYITEQTHSRVRLLFVPGNHDCSLSNVSSAREVLISNMKPDSVDQEYYLQVSDVQKNFNDFSTKYQSQAGSLCSVIDFDIEGEKIAFLLINTAWMSSLHETPGAIVLPKQFYPNIDSRQYRAVFSAFHHPMNWLNPDYKSDFINYIRRVTDIAFVGHEHQRDQFSAKGMTWNFSEIHGKELQDSGSNDSAFSIITFDASMQNYEDIGYVWSEEAFSYIREYTRAHQYHKNIAAFETVFQPNAKTVEWMNDIGITVNHFAKDEVVLPDLFVWPELMPVDFSEDHRYQERIRDNILQIATQSNVTVFTGSASAGKTSFAKMIYLSFEHEDTCCIYLSGSDIKSADSQKITNVIDEAFIDQYGAEHLEKFKQLSRDKRIILVDDLDCMKLHGERRKAVLEFLCVYSTKVIVFMASAIEVPALLSAECFKELEKVPVYEIMPMGNRKRKELISKWYSLHNEWKDPEEIEKQIETSILQVDTFLGNGASFIPAIPVFIINVLQNSDAAQNSNFKGSQYGFLYESLIQKSLSTVSNVYKQPGAYNIDIGILSKLAFEILKAKKKSFTEDELQVIIQAFSEDRLLDISKDDFLRRMCEAKIFKKDIENGVGYKFRYPYIFYYFAGHHIAYNLNNEDVTSMVEYMSARLFNEDYGNIIIFVCHFANSVEVIESILLNAYCTLNSYEPFSFQKDNPLLQDIQIAVDALLPKVIGGNDEVFENRNLNLQRLDDAGINDGHVSDKSDTIEDEIAEKEKDLAAISASLKTLEVLGQILQNYPAEIDGTVKIDIIDEIHKLGMRSVQAIISTMGYLEEALVSVVMERAMKKSKELRRDEVAQKARQLVTVLISGMVRGMISKVAASLNSVYLLPAAKSALTAEDDISAKLILQELKLNCLDAPDYNELQRLKSELEKDKNQFAQCILSSIVANYLKYNKCDHRLRSKLCQLFGFSERKTFVNNQIALLE